MAQTSTSEIVHPYIEQNSNILNGEPIIKGTRIGVRHIVEWDHQAYSVDEIVAMYPHTTHAQIYDALSYACDHKAEIDLLIETNKEDQVRQDHEGKAWLK